MLSMDRRPINASSPIAVTPSGMVTWLSSPLYFTSTVPYISNSWLKSESGINSDISKAVKIRFLFIFIIIPFSLITVNNPRIVGKSVSVYCCSS